MSRFREKAFSGLLRLRRSGESKISTLGHFLQLTVLHVYHWLLLPIVFGYVMNCGVSSVCSGLRYRYRFACLTPKLLGFTHSWPMPRESRNINYEVIDMPISRFATSTCLSTKGFRPSLIILIRLTVANLIQMRGSLRLGRVHYWLLARLESITLNPLITNSDRTILLGVRVAARFC